MEIQMGSDSEPSRAGATSPSTASEPALPDATSPTAAAHAKTREGATEKKKGPQSVKKNKKWKKPKGMPKRPLSAYNLFFAHERQELLEAKNSGGGKHEGPDQSSSSVKIGFAGLARSVAAKWKTMDDTSKAYFVATAQKEQARYKKEIEAWKASQNNQKQPSSGATGIAGSSEERSSPSSASDSLTGMAISVVESVQSRFGQNRGSDRGSFETLIFPMSSDDVMTMKQNPPFINSALTSRVNSAGVSHGDCAVGGDNCFEPLPISGPATAQMQPLPRQTEPHLQNFRQQNAANPVMGFFPQMFQLLNSSQVTNSLASAGGAGLEGGGMYDPKFLQTSGSNTYSHASYQCSAPPNATSPTHGTMCWGGEKTGMEPYPVRDSGSANSTEPSAGPSNVPSGLLGRLISQLDDEDCDFLQSLR